MQLMLVSAGNTDKDISLASQFPLWDFFECNFGSAIPMQPKYLKALNSLFGISLNATELLNKVMPEEKVTLNSLFGISLNATLSRRWLAPTPTYLTLNSLFGISLNATNATETSLKVTLTGPSQFPFWDFFECNYYKPVKVGRADKPTLNSLFGISLNATYLFGPHMNLQLYLHSQFPFWDFFECNTFESENGKGMRVKGLSIPFLGFL